MLYLQKNIKFIRKIWRLTQPQFGQRYNATKAMVISYELGKANPDDLFLSRLANDAGITVGDLKSRHLNEKEIKVKKIEKVDTANISGLDEPLPLGDLNITLKDYLNEVRQQKEFLQQLLIDKVGKLDANLSTTLGGVLQISLHVESAREVILKSLARLEKKPVSALTDEADKIVIQLMKEHKKQGSSVDGDR